MAEVERVALDSLRDLIVVGQPLPFAVLDALGVRHDLEAAVALGLGDDGLLQLGQAPGGGVAVVLRVAAGGDGSVERGGVHPCQGAPDRGLGRQHLARPDPVTGQCFSVRFG